MKRFLDLASFSREQVLDLLGLAQALQDKPEPRALANKILGLVFFNPSLRTLASFQAGMARLGGSAFVINPGLGTWQLETRPNAIMKGAAAEHIREGIPALASYCDVLGVRAFADGKNLDSDLNETLFGMIDKLCDKPLINMESAMNHPCQALADWRTLDELKIPTRAKFVLSWAYHPKALPLAVPAATVHMAAMRGMEVVVLRPDGFALPRASDGEGAFGGERRRRIVDRDLGSRRGAHRRERDLCQGVGHDHLLRRCGSRFAPARGPLGLVRARALVRARPARCEAHALPARAPQCRGRR